MKIFRIFIMIVLMLLTTLGTVFSAGMFQALAVEGNLTVENQSATYYAHSQISAWVYVLCALWLIVILYLAFTLWRDGDLNA